MDGLCTCGDCLFRRHVEQELAEAQWWPVTMADVVILERFPSAEDVERERYWPTS